MLFSVLVKAYDPRLIEVGSADGETKADPPDAPNPYWSKACVLTPITMNGVYRFLIMPTDNNFDQYKNHQNKKSKIKSIQLLIPDPRIFVDPGHGFQNDPGALCREHQPPHEERNINCQIAQYCSTQIQGCPGPPSNPHPCAVEVASQAVRYRDRATTAFSFRANAVICLHCNSSTNTDARGTESYYDGHGPRSQNLATEIASQIANLCDLPNRGSFDALTNQARSPGAYNILHSTYHQRWNELNRRRRRPVPLPALVLAEMAFISNADDEQILMNNADGTSNSIRVAIHRGVRAAICAAMGLGQCPNPNP